MRRRHRTVRGLLLGKLRQIQKHHIRRAENHGPGQRGRSRIAGRQVIGRAVLADGLNAPAIGIGDGHQPQLDLTAVMHQPDHVGRVGPLVHASSNASGPPVLNR